MNTTMSPPPILWRQVLTLTAVQAVVSLMWVIYGAYLPGVFGQIGVNPEAINLLFVVENALAIAIHPLAGSLSDRSLHWLGTRFPIISVGVVSASALFLAVPLLAIAGGAGLRWVMLFVLVAWSIAMTLFHSPIVSLLFIYAAVPSLPLVASLLICVQRLVGMTKPLVERMLLAWGAVPTFFLGAIALLLAALVLRQITPPAAPVTRPQLPSLISLGLIGLTGLTIGWGTRLVIDNLPKVFSLQIPDLASDRLMVWVGLGLAILTVPAGWAATHWAIRWVLVGSLAATSGVALLIAWVPGAAVLWVGTLLLLLGLSGIFDGAFPFAIAYVPPERIGLGIGMYLAGLSAASASFNWFISPTQYIAPAVGAGLGAIALAIALIAVWLTPNPQPTEPAQP